MYIEEAVKKFKELPFAICHEIENASTLASVRRIEEKYNVNLANALIYIFIDELPIDKVADFLVRENAIEKNTAVEINREIKETIWSPLITRIGFLNIDKNRPLTIKQEQNYAESIFLKGLKAEINNDPFIIEIVNKKLFMLLYNDLNFKNTLERSLLNNNEELVQEAILLKDKQIISTISHLLKDFIRQNGSDLFDTVEALSYITVLDNIRKLSDQEKRLALKVLNVYRNIKFFPDSMPDDNGETWEIIPIDRIGNTEKARTVSGPPKTIEEKQIDQLVKIKTDERTNPLARRALDEEIEAKKKIENLKIMANRYKEGSLERRAIEDEIRKLG